MEILKTRWKENEREKKKKQKMKNKKREKSGEEAEKWKYERENGREEARSGLDIPRGRIPLQPTVET